MIHLKYWAMFKLKPSRFRGTSWVKILSCGMILCGLSSAQVFVSSPAGKAEFLPPAISSAWSFTDLDGDRQSDVVRSTAVGPEGLEYRYNIEFKMSTGRFSAPITVRSDDAWGVQVASRDVDGDHDMDLVVTGGAPRHPLGVWTNDGEGNFTGADARQFSLSVWLDGISLCGSMPAAPDTAVDMLSNSSPVVMSLNRAQTLSDAGVLLLTHTMVDRAKSAVPSGTRPRAPPLA
jgi:hypothetical protein